VVCFDPKRSDEGAFTTVEDKRAATGQHRNMQSPDASLKKKTLLPTGRLCNHSNFIASLVRFEPRLRPGTGHTPQEMKE
jgi:hypothetical protein